MNVDLANFNDGLTVLEGVSLVRALANVSQGQGDTDLEKWSIRDAVRLQEINNQGSKIILVLNHQTWGEGQGYNWKTFQDDEAKLNQFIFTWAEFASRIIYMTHEFVEFYQVWNEPDSIEGLASVPLKPATYKRMVSRLANLLRLKKIETKLIGAGMNSGPVTGSNYYRAIGEALDELYAVAFHPYGRSTSRSLYGHFGLISESLRLYASLGKPMFVTEFGVLDLKEDPAALVNSYAEKMINAFKQMKVEGACWFAFDHEQHNCYGVRKDGWVNLLLFQTLKDGYFKKEPISLFVNNTNKDIPILEQPGSSNIQGFVSPQRVMQASKKVTVIIGGKKWSRVFFPYNGFILTDGIAEDFIEGTFAPF